MSNSSVQKTTGTSSLKVGSGYSPLKNVAVNYMYRDAGNYKCHETVIFANPRGVSVSELWGRINQTLREVMLFEGQPIFKPELVGLPTVFLFDKPGFSKNVDDHDWHELCSVEETAEPVTQSNMSTIDEFMIALQESHLSIKWS